MNPKTTTRFGAREVSAAEKPALVRDVFSRVAPSYDRMNDLMSFGQHRIWKDALVARLNPRASDRILDLAGGTGDVALRLHASLSRRTRTRTPTRTRGAQAAPPAFEIVVLDAAPEMLARGRTRALNTGRSAEITWRHGDAENLPFAEASFSAATLAFGLRNMTEPEAACAEAYRVLRPGGRFAVLEFCIPDQPLFAEAYAAWSRFGIPFLGARIAGDVAAYRYLVESIEAFASAEEVSTMLVDAGFASVRSERLCGGVAALHLAWKF